MPLPPPQAQGLGDLAKDSAQARSAPHAGHILVWRRKRPLGHVTAVLREHASLCSGALALWVPATAVELAPAWPRPFPGFPGAHPAVGLGIGPPDGGVRETWVHVGS